MGRIQVGTPIPELHEFRRSTSSQNKSGASLRRLALLSLTYLTYWGRLFLDQTLATLSDLPYFKWADSLSRKVKWRSAPKPTSFLPVA
jgi:hypothetical protein